MNSDSNFMDIKASTPNNYFLWRQLIHIFPLHSTIDNDELHDFKSVLTVSIQIIVLLKHTHILIN